MQKDCWKTIWLETTPSERDQKIKSEFWDFIYLLLKGLIEILLCLIFAYYFRKSFVTEVSSYNNNISFPFENLTIMIQGDFSVSVTIHYNSDKYPNYIKVIPNNHRLIDIKSELNVSKLILENEFKDSIAIFFRINDNLDQIKDKKGEIIIYNKIYYLNTSNQTIKYFYKYYKFNIEDELLTRHFEKEVKMYKYSVHSRSIETPTETKGFSIIDENEKTRNHFFEKNYFHFGILFTKRNFLNKLKVIKEDFWDKFFLYFGIITFVFEILLPLILHIKDNRKKNCNKNFGDKQPLRENENRTEIEMEGKHQEDDLNN